VTRPPTGQVLDRPGKEGVTYALRFRAYGLRRYITLGGAAEGWDLRRAKVELENVLADVRRGIWKPPERAAIEAPREEPTFHEFASEYVALRVPELRPRSAESLRWAFTHHLIGHFGEFFLPEITPAEIDRYKQVKLAEGELSPNSINRTIARLSEVLELATEYGLVASNAASGKRRRLTGTRPRRPWVDVFQLPALLDAAAPLYAKRGRPLLATLAGCGLRIDEALSLERQHVNRARETLTVVVSKTDAGVRAVDLTPAVLAELEQLLDRIPPEPAALVFGTRTGRKDTRQNAGRMLDAAVKDANVKLAEKGIEPIDKIGLHALRRTYASLRCALVDDVAYTAAQLGHVEATFTLNTYTNAVRRRQKLTEQERAEFDRAVEWARMGTNDEQGADVISLDVARRAEKPRVSTAFGSSRASRRSP
jgi:integrase